MAYDLNEVNVLGRLGADPEVKTFQNGGKICNLRVATSESWKDKQTGEKQERTEWHSVTLRGDGLINYVQNNARKGSRVFVKGKLQTRKWQDQSGNDRYSTEIVIAGFEGKFLLLSDKPAGSGSGQRSGGDDWGGQSSGSGAGATNNQRMGGGHSSGAGGGGFTDDLDDDIPFDSTTYACRKDGVSGNRGAKQEGVSEWMRRSGNPFPGTSCSRRLVGAVFARANINNRFRMVVRGPDKCAPPMALSAGRSRALSTPG